MKVTRARRIGFCFGVKRAVAMAERAIGAHRKICSLGSIIHNKQVVDDLARRGLAVVKSVDGIRNGAVLISSHGISPKIARQIRRKGLKIVDTTCPFVLNAQRIAQRLGEEGYAVVIVGDAKHPEVRALVDFAPKGATVVRDRAEARALRLRKDARVSVISQTTQSTANFLEAVKAIIEKKPKELRVFNTICSDAEDRQRLARSLAARVDLMLVIGGRHSANTKRLYEVCKEVLDNTRLIETEDEVERAWFRKVRSVGITSGASTPDWVVDKVALAVTAARSK